MKINTVSLGEIKYPRLLAKSKSPPQTIYYIGNLPDSISIACIGTRKPTEFGATVANRITSFLTYNGFSIISGLALGIDTVCHKTALEIGGNTVAVLASGLDSVYPKQNELLAEEILDKHGCIISEHMEGIKLSKINLIRRNRIITGLSLGTICFQSKLAGGSIHSCNFILAEQRPLFFPVPPKALDQEPESEANISFELNNPLVSRISSKEEYKNMLAVLDMSYKKLVE